MSKIAIIVENQKDASYAVRKVPYFFSTTLLNIGDFDPKVVADHSMVLFDVTLCNNKHAAVVKRTLGLYPGKPHLCFVARRNRAELIQAQAVGAKLVADTGETIENTISIIRKMMTSSLAGRLPENVPAATRKAALQVDRLFGDLTGLIVDDSPLPMVSVGNCADSVINALKTDGVDSWLDAVQRHHSHTFRHSMMVTGYAAVFALSRGENEEQTQLMTSGALLHDIGKIKIPLAILDKPGHLTDDEFEQIKQHPVYSREILSAQRAIDPELVNLAVHHHEFLDGSGYPDGLKGDQISVPVRMLTICDIFSALTEKRSYKEPYSPRTAYSVLLDMGTKLDARLLMHFRKIAFDCDIGRIKTDKYKNRHSSTDKRRSAYC